MTPHAQASRRLTTVWVLMVAATVLVGWLAEHPGFSPRGAVAWTFGVAAFKARLVLLHYMELRHAPLRWRVMFEGWAVLCAGGILAAYWVHAGGVGQAS